MREASSSSAIALPRNVIPGSTRDPRRPQSRTRHARLHHARLRHAQPSHCQGTSSRPKQRHPGPDPGSPPPTVTNSARKASSRSAIALPSSRHPGLDPGSPPPHSHELGAQGFITLRLRHAQPSHCQATSSRARPGIPAAHSHELGTQGFITLRLHHAQASSSSAIALPRNVIPGSTRDPRGPQSRTRQAQASSRSAIALPRNVIPGPTRDPRRPQSRTWHARLRHAQPSLCQGTSSRARPGIPAPHTDGLGAQGFITLRLRHAQASSRSAIALHAERSLSMPALSLSKGRRVAQANQN